MEYETQDLDKLLDSILAGEAIEVPKEETKKKKRIMIVDDDVRVARLINKYLEDYEVATAIGGKAAFHFLETKTVDLILLDYEMPGEDGPTVLKKLRANSKTKSIPVVFLTGVASKEKIQEVLRLRPQGYLLKPVVRNKLLMTIENLIG